MISKVFSRSLCFALSFGILVSTTSCALIVKSPYFTQMVGIAIQTARGWVVTKTVTYVLDKLFEYIFQEAAEETSDVEYIQTNVRPDQRNPNKGIYSFSHMAFYVQTSRNGQAFTDIIEIPSYKLPFDRMSDGNWELSRESKELIKERTEVAAAQRSLLCYGFKGVRKVDGILGDHTGEALKEFQASHRLTQTGVLDYYTREFLLKK